jgi:hypothetical protein
MTVSEQDAGTQAGQLSGKCLQDWIGCRTQGAIGIEFTDIGKFWQPHLGSA